MFSNVKLLAGKLVFGEVDVLVLYGDRAVVVQAKSKRLTVQARKGDLRQARDDFGKAVQDANDQAFACATALLKPDCTLALDDGRSLKLSCALTEVYVVCVVADAYPALTFQASYFLRYQSTKSIQPPLVADVFLIDVLAEMLASPLRFLSYVNRRVNYHKKILTPDELGVLAIHLRQNLWIDQDTDVLAILDQITPELDAAMLVRRKGFRGKATPDGVLTRLRGTVVGRIVEQIEAEPEPAAIELGLMLLTLGEDVTDTINRVVDGWKTQGVQGGVHGISMAISRADAGLTLQANRLPLAQAQNHLASTCHVRKYESQVTKWFGVLLGGKDFSMLRQAVVIRYEWQPDEELAEAVLRFPPRVAGLP